MNGSINNLKSITFTYLNLCMVKCSVSDNEHILFHEKCESNNNSDNNQLSF